MRTYLILKERAERWNADAEIQALVQEARSAGTGAPAFDKYSAASRDALLAAPLDRVEMASRGLGLREAGSADDGGPLRRAVGSH